MTDKQTQIVGMRILSFMGDISPSYAKSRTLWGAAFKFAPLKGGRQGPPPEVASHGVVPHLFNNSQKRLS